MKKTLKFLFLILCCILSMSLFFACGKDEAYQIGYQDGYDSHDENWKHNKELIDELKRQEYQLGLNDLWYAIRQLELSPADGALSVDEIEKIFGTSIVYSILQNVHPENVIDKIRAYEEQQKADEMVFTNADKLKEVFGEDAEDIVSWNRTN